MKRIIFLLILLFSFPAQSLETKDEYSININGIGEVEVAVDNVIINAGIDTRDKDLVRAKDDNQKKYNSVLAVLNHNGLAKSAIKSNFVFIRPVYVNCYQQVLKCDSSKIDYYQVSRALDIKLDNLQKYDALIAALAESGTTSVGTSQYGVSDMVKYRDQAREIAIDSAKVKAEKIAKKLGVVLGKPLKFESYDEAAEAAPRPMMMQAMGGGDAGRAPTTDVQTMGKIKIVVNVNIAYGIE